MTVTILLEIPVNMLEAAKKLEVPLRTGKLAERLGLGELGSLYMFPGNAWEIADNLCGVHPVPTVDGQVVVACKPLQTYDPIRPGQDDSFLVSLEDGTQETIRWDDSRLDDPDEVLPYFDDRFAELE